MKAYVEQVLPAKLDLADEYITNQSLGFDLHIIWRTMFAISRFN